MEEQGEGALASGETAVEETNAGNDQPHEERADNQVDIVIFDASVLCVNVPVKRVAALGMSWVKLRLAVVSIGRCDQAWTAYLQSTTWLEL